VKPDPTSEVPDNDSSLGVAVALRLAGGRVYPGVMFATRKLASMSRRSRCSRPKVRAFFRKAIHPPKPSVT